MPMTMELSVRTKPHFMILSVKEVATTARVHFVYF